MAKKLTGSRAVVLALTAVLALVLLGWLFGSSAIRPAEPPALGDAIASATSARGGTLVSTVRTDPRSFNRFVARDRTSNLVSLLVHAKLVQTNMATQEVEPALAESWSPGPDGRSWTMKLRPGVRFSDGTPFTSADVLFSLAAAYDERTASPLGGSLMVGDRPLTMSAPDADTVIVTFPAPFGPGLRLLDNLPILPRHKLGAALEQGTLREAWGLTTSLTELAGLGPFVLTEYRPGERLAFARNPQYWAADGDGQPLPRLDGLTILIVPDHDAELLRLESGEADLTSGEVRPEDLAALRQAQSQGRLQLIDVGVGLDADFLWFNLKDGAVPASRRWLQRRELRQAIATAVDRQAFADTVYLGAAVPIAGPVTPGNKEWHDPSITVPSRDVARAREWLAAAGLTDANRDGQFEAPDGTAARITLMTQKGNSIRERSAAFLQQDLQAIGLGVDVVTLEAPALIERITNGTYEAAYFGAQASDTDPASNLDFWLSSGAFHAWNPDQERPATAWEARIDALMQEQVASPDRARRRELFHEVQRILAEEVPTIHFVAPRISLAAQTRVTGIRPGLLQPFVLWNASRIGVKP